MIMASLVKLLPGISAVDLAIYIKKEDTLIITDLHIGYEQKIRMRGLLIPFNQLKELIKRFENILKQLNKSRVKRIVVNGDLKHEFGTITNQEWHDIQKFIEFLQSNSDELVIIEGNHDVILEPITKKKEISIVEYLIINDVLLMHGNYIPEHLPKGINTIIIGHEHPAVSFRDRPSEKFKCFLIGKWNRRNLIVIPSFFLINPGTDITKENFISPFLKDIKNFQVFVVEDKIRNFGKVKDVMKL